MSFVGEFNRLAELRSPRLRTFQALLDPGQDLEAMADRAAATTRQHFGRTMRLFAPLYLSNECVNNCKYCGFSRDNPIFRTTLTVDQVETEARHLVGQGFRNILLVAGEHPKFVSNGYMEDCVKRLAGFVPSVSLEVGPMEAEEYLPIVQAGAEGLVVYQETYDRETYDVLHTAGPKKNFDWRLECPERAYEAGFRRIGIGALLGLADWRKEALALVAHCDYLLRHCWRSSITISLPRLRPAAGEFEPTHPISDRDFTQLIFALRLTFPQVGLVLSTREPARLRDGLMPLGITLMSAGARTEPGGYTGAGRETLHRTERGKLVPLIHTEGEYATEQFAISDDRSPGEIAEKLKSQGLDPVWKDWDQGLSYQEQAV
jgi:2-iminoacetate synthase